MNKLPNEGGRRGCVFPANEVNGRPSIPLKAASNRHANGVSQTASFPYHGLCHNYSFDSDSKQSLSDGFETPFYPGVNSVLVDFPILQPADVIRDIRC